MPCLISDDNVRPAPYRIKTKTHKQMVFAVYLESFSEYPVLQQRVLFVLEQLPSEVQRDFLEDPRFGVTIDNYQPETGWSFLMPAPGPPGNGSRCVILRPKLATASIEFATYVIAHEFAHAFLRNGGWGEITDIEEAADAMAASWGFHRPHRNSWPAPSNWTSRKS
jgi:hypothetical protein